MTRRISLDVNDCPIEMDYFVQGFLDHTVYGMISSLEEAISACQVECISWED